MDDCDERCECCTNQSRCGRKSRGEGGSLLTLISTSNKWKMWQVLSYVQKIETTWASRTVCQSADRESTVPNVGCDSLVLVDSLSSDGVRSRSRWTPRQDDGCHGILSAYQYFRNLAQSQTTPPCMSIVQCDLYSHIRIRKKPCVRSQIRKKRKSVLE